MFFKFREVIDLLACLCNMKKVVVFYLSFQLELMLSVYANSWTTACCVQPSLFT